MMTFNFLRNIFYRDFYEFTLKDIIKQKKCISLSPELIEELEAKHYLKPLSTNDEEYLGVIIAPEYAVKIERNHITRILVNDKVKYDFYKVEHLNADNSITARSNVDYAYVPSIYFLTH